MQPHDILPNGEQDECDGCPNKTVWNGRLVSECRKEDYLLYGRPVVSAPKRLGAADASAFALRAPARSSTSEVAAGRGASI